AAQLTSGDVAVPIAMDFSLLFETMLKVLPETKNFVIVLGASPTERYWKQELQRELRGFEGRVRFSYTKDLSFAELLKQVATLPRGCGIVLGLVAVDRTGVAYNGGDAIDGIHRAANAPLFTYSDNFFGLGIVGGPLLSIQAVSRQTVDVAVRILAGEPPQ